MKRTLFSIIFIIMLLLLCGKTPAQDIYNEYTPAQNEAFFNQSMFRIDVVDPAIATNTKGASYPGLRGTNQLVVYTPAFGYRTGTNEFGTEAIIEGNTVTSLSGADSLIPANGFVISGHGTAKKWINENVMIGSKIYLDLDNKIITSYLTSDSFLFSARERIKEVQNMLSYYSQIYSNYNPKKTKQNLEKANDYIVKAQKNTEDAQKYASRAIEYANLAMATVIPYDTKELKGIWIRPTYFNKSEIENVLNNLENSGIDNIFIETYYHGKTIFPSETMEKYGFIKQYEDYTGFDPLKAWINEAHKRDIKVHIWFQAFYVGNKPPETHPEYILAKNPQWANCQKKNANSQTIAYSVSEHNGYFIDPANPEVQEFLYELLCEITEKYKPDGINLDYIRYPQALSSNYTNYDLSNWGYTHFARNEFKTIYGTDPIEIKPNDSLWSHWQHYRCEKITDFVRKVSNLCKTNNIELTTVIFPNKDNALTTKMQDWKSWSINNLVDGFTPLLLTCDDKTAMNLIEQVLRNKNSNTKLYAGLFVTFMNGSNSDLIKQIHAARKYSINGIILFDYAHLKDSYIETLTQSVFKPKKEFELGQKTQNINTEEHKNNYRKKEKRKYGRRK